MAAGKGKGKGKGTAEEPDDEAKKHAGEVKKRLSRAIPEGKPELDFRTPWQLLVATMLSAQSTDKMVNKVTPELFRRYPTPEALGKAKQETVEKLVKSTGFFRNKAKAIRAASKAVADQHGGEVPRSMEAMVELPGVARKTANVVLGAAYGLPTGIVVDTHAGRVSRRLELSEQKDTVKVERELCALVAKKDWIAMGHRPVLHGRYLCTSKKPACPRCPLNEVCPSAEAEPEGRWTARADAEHGVVASRGEATG